MHRFVYSSLSLSLSVSVSLCGKRGILNNVVLLSSGCESVWPSGKELGW